MLIFFFRFLKINDLGKPCPDGWDDWSEWTPCAVSCGAGEKYRTRRCNGDLDNCEGEPHESEPCQAKCFKSLTLTLSRFES